MAKVSLRQMTVQDIRNLEQTLSYAHYNSRAYLSFKGVPYRGCNKFTLPGTTYEQSRTYLFNNLIALKALLNELDLGERTETTNVNYDEVA